MRSVDQPLVEPQAEKFPEKGVLSEMGVLKRHSVSLFWVECPGAFNGSNALSWQETL